jgi:molybdate transport system substrate-binding protein
MKGFANPRSPARIILALLVAAFLAGPFVPLAAPAQKSAPVTLTVSAAISLKDALDEIAKLYEAKHPGSTISYNYGGSGTLQHQIEQGARFRPNT